MEEAMKIKKSALYFLLLLGLLSAPIYGQGKLNIITNDGYIVSYYDFPSIDLPVKSFYFGDNDLMWVVDKKIKEIDPNFQPTIKILKDGMEVSDTVNGKKGEAILLNVIGEGNSPTVYCEYPTNSLNGSQFSKTYLNPGTYLAVFRAEQGSDVNKLISHRIIKIIVSDSINYIINISLNPPGAGTIDISPPGGTYPAGTQVTLTATANSGYNFIGWGGDISGSTNPYPLIIDKNYNIVANFQSQGTGPYSDKVASAQPVNQWDGKSDYIVSNFGIQKYQTKYFLIDPKGFNIPWKSELLYIQIRDKYQSKYVNIYYPIIYKLTANNDLITKYTIPGSGDFGKIISGFKKSEYDSGVKFLLELSEKGMGSQNDGLTVMWHFN